MNSRERLQAIFRHENYDRLPIWCNMPYTYESNGADVYKEASYAKLVQVVRDHTDFIDRTSINGGDIASQILFSHPELKQFEVNENGMRYRCIAWEDVRFKKRIDQQMAWSSGTSAASDNYVGDIEQLEEILQLPYEMPLIDVPFYRKKGELVGNAGIRCLVIEDSFSILHHIVSEEDACIFAATEQDAVRGFLDAVLERQLSYYRQFLDADLADVYFLAGPEFLTAPLASPQTFRTLCEPYNKAIVDLIHAYGKQVILHCHGKMRSVLDSLAAIGADALHPFEPAPNGDATVAELRAALGQEVILIGNIEYSDLSQKTPDEIDTLVRQLIEETGGHNLILSPSCSMYEPTITERQAENYIALIRAGLRYGANNRHLFHI